MLLKGGILRCIHLKPEKLQTMIFSWLLRELFSTLRALSFQQYLGYTTNLILYLTFLSPDYERLMFEQPLSECKFQVSKPHAFSS